MDLKTIRGCAKRIVDTFILFGKRAGDVGSISHY